MPHTTVTVHIETWRRLNQFKEPGDSFNDVIEMLIDEYEGERCPVSSI